MRATSCTSSTRCSAGTPRRHFHLATVLRTWGASPPAGSWMAWRDTAPSSARSRRLHRERAAAALAHGDLSSQGEGTAPPCRLAFGVRATDLKLPAARRRVLVEATPTAKSCAGCTPASRRWLMSAGSISPAVPRKRSNVRRRRPFRSPRRLTACTARVGGCSSSVLRHRPSACDMAAALDFVVSVCDHAEYRAAWETPAVLAEMPTTPCSPGGRMLAGRRHVRMTQDRRSGLDRRAQVRAFYVAAVGSQATSANVASAWRYSTSIRTKSPPARAGGLRSAVGRRPRSPWRSSPKSSPSGAGAATTFDSARINKACLTADAAAFS